MKKINHEKINPVLFNLPMDKAMEAIAHAAAMTAIDIIHKRNTGIAYSDYKRLLLNTIFPLVIKTSKECKNENNKRTASKRILQKMAGKKQIKGGKGSKR